MPVKIDKNLWNYSSKAIKYLTHVYKKHAAFREVYSGIYPLFLSALHRGVKFYLPDEGAILTERAAQIFKKTGPVKHLPYPITILEYPFKPKDGLKPSPVNHLAPKRITIGMDFELLDKQTLRRIFILLVIPMLIKASKAAEIAKADTYATVLREDWIEDYGENGIAIFDCPYYSEGGEWQMFPRMMFLPQNHPWKEIEMPLGIAGADYETQYTRITGEERIPVGMADSAFALTQLCTALECNNVTTERVCSFPAKIRRKAERKGNKKPIFEYHVLTIKPGRTTTNSDYGGHHASPRVHLRRGHRREYKPGKFTWVQPCVVGSKGKGLIHKDYRIEGKI